MTPVLHGEQLRQLLHSLDDPDHLGRPADYHHHRTRAQFDQLAHQLDHDFHCQSAVDRNVQDASLHGRIEIPATATATSHDLVISISNFDALAVVSVDNPGIWTDAETADLIHPDDARRINNALTGLRYTHIPEEPLWRRYDGAVNPDILGPSATWWIRYFDYL